MRCAILAFVGGAALLQTSATLPGQAALTAMAAGVILLVLFAIRTRRVPLRLALAGGVGLLCGYAWAALLAQAALSQSLPAALEGRDLTVTGTVATLPYAFDGGTRFQLAVERVDTGERGIPSTVMLGWYGQQRDGGAAVPDVRPGERWQLRVRLQRPHGNANPHGFDYEAWLLEQGVRATGYVRYAGANRRLDSFVPGFGSMVERTRAWLRARILAALAGKQYAGVIVALVVGDQRGIPQSDWAVFNRTGIGHLVSISGLHITMVAGLFAFGASWLWRRSFFTDACLPLLLPAQKVAALAGAFTALLYVLLAGFGIPAQRTLYMLAVVALAVWTGRIAGITHVLTLAAGVVVLLDPWAVLAPGFWLSFGAVAAILYATAGRVEPSGHPWSIALQLAARTQYAVTVGLVPLTMLLFAQVSVASPIANAIAIPLVSLLVTPLALAGSCAPPVVSELLLYCAHACMAGLAEILGALSRQSWAVWSAPVPGPAVLTGALVGVVWMLAPRGWPLRLSGAAACLPLLAAVPSHPGAGRLAVTVLDVGQGMALLIETRNHRLLYDTGPSYGPGSDGGNRVIAPYLKARGINALDGVIVSHSDADHSGGALSVMDAVDVGWLLSSLPEGHRIARAARRHLRCVAGQHWILDGVRFDVLHPTASSYADPHLKSNARGCVLRISAGDKAVLLPADIEAPQEAELLASGVPLRADVLVAPHHGSGTSSTSAFLQAVAPGIAVFQVGYRNRYHHPKPEVWERYRAMGVQRWRTDVSGAIMLDIGSTVETRGYRQQHARYWYGR